MLQPPTIARDQPSIVSLFACHFIALLCCCVIERELRAAMTRHEITDLPLYHEDRSCTAPTAARIFDHFADVQRHHLTHKDQRIQTFEPQLTPLQIAGITSGADQVVMRGDRRSRSFTALGFRESRASVANPSMPWPIISQSDGSRWQPRTRPRSLRRRT